MSYVAGFLTFMSIGGFPSFVEDMKVHGFRPIAKTPKKICLAYFQHHPHKILADNNRRWWFSILLVLQVFSRERLNGHYGVAAFVIGTSLSSLPFLFLISIVSGSIVYFMVQLHPGWDHFVYFVLMLFACVACVESLMMAVASVVPNFLMGIITGAGIQVYNSFFCISFVGISSLQ